MSAVRCREGRLGKFTRPKSQWDGRARGVRRSPYGAAMQRQFSIMAKSFGKDASQNPINFGQGIARRSTTD